MNKQVYADDPWQEIPYEEARTIQHQRTVVEIDALRFVADIMAKALNPSKQISTQVNEVNNE